MTSYSSRVAYMIGRKDELGFTLLGGNSHAKVAFQKVPGKRRFASLLLTVLGLSNGKGGFPSRTIYGQIGTLGNPVRLIACISLAYAGYPSIMRTLGTVAALGSSVARRVISNTLCRSRMSTLGVRKIPSIFTSNGLLRMNHNRFNRLLTGLRRRCKVSRAGTITRIGRCSIVITNKNPTKISTTVCSTHGKLHMTVMTRHINKRIGRAINVRGLVSIPRAANDRLTSGLGARLLHCPISLLRRHGVRGIRVLKGRGLIAASINRGFLTPTLVVTANTD